MINTKLFGCLMFLAVILVSETAYADRPRGHGGRVGHGGSHVGIGFYLGVPYSYPYYPYYPYSYYPYAYYPPPVVVSPAPEQPPVYIEQDPSTTQQTDSESYYWYYCKKSEAYYPYVKECPDGWQKVSPTPPSQP